MKGWVVAGFGEEFALTLQNGAREEYASLIPKIPYIKEVRARALNSFLRITA
jgi:hypothetical protein